MADIYENTILCENCNKKTVKGFAIKNGFKIRSWKCPSCNKVWYHPSDMQEYENFQKIKNQTFQVKLRMVGNSYTISIPREIIEFEEEMHRKINEMISMTMEEPTKLSIFFSKEIRKFINEEDDEEESKIIKNEDLEDDEDAWKRNKTKS